jgi:ATP-binding cassette subfamily F protein 3
MLRIDTLTYRIGARVLLDEADASINPGHRVGLVGRNGSGKTTLLRLITGELELDGGRIDTPSRWRVGMTRQEAPGGSDSLIDTVLAADREVAGLTAEAETARDPHRIAEIHDRLRDRDAHTARARAARILAGLGFSEAAQQRPCSEYSGGWRMRVALATLLFTRPDLLLLDEPTNHLDLEATLWLEDYLRRYPGTVLLVSHDRDLLNRAVGQILHLEGGKLTLYQGGYDRFERTRAMRLELNEKLRVKQEVQRAHMQKFVERFRYKATKARQAQSRLKMLERMQPIPEHQHEGGVTFAFPDPDPLPPPLYSIDNAAVGYDGTPVLTDLSLRLDADDRIALLGANGNGKSTLIKLLAGRLRPLSGDVVRSNKLRVGYFAQHQADELDLDVTPVVELGRKRPGEPEVRLRSHLGRFGFTQQRAVTTIANLSGGEKARLLFALMTCDKPHILLLDEPTNHLDVDSRQALIQALTVFEGAVVIVTHDPHVIELTADRFWLVENGRVGPYDGDMNDYRSLLLGRGNGRNGAGGNARNSDGDQGGLDKKEQRRLAAEKRTALAPMKKRLTAAEAAVHRLEKEKARLAEAMADPELYRGDSRKLIDLKMRLGRVEKDLASAEEAWISAQEAFDRAEAEPV